MLLFFDDNAIVSVGGSLSARWLIMKKQAFAAVVLGALLALGGCASSLTGDVYSREDARAPLDMR